ncbi:hypothetical protein [Streptomyces silvensis]|uniref:hypothetical protein n=1 Tax=Streptomyces silvensis TaxID=1765722 RepID=UPI000AA04BAC|nr:hypothetical protein [Streptomyces silvensis]
MRDVLERVEGARAFEECQRLRLTVEQVCARARVMRTRAEEMRVRTREMRGAAARRERQ